MLKSLCIVFVGLLPFLALCQAELMHHDYTTGEGLKSNTIYDVYQDHNGLLYLGHDKGMTIFNGKSFRHAYSPIDVRAISNITPLDDTTLICRDFQGQSFLLSNDSLTPFFTDCGENNGSPTYVSDNARVFGFQNQSFFQIIHKKTKNIVLTGLEYDRIWSLKMANDTVYAYVNIKSQRKLVRYLLPTKTLIDEQFMPVNGNVEIIKNRNNIVWLDKKYGLLGGFDKGNPFQISLKEAGVPENVKYTSTYLMQDGRYVLGTFDGIYVFDRQLQLTGHYLSGYQISAFMEDVEGNVWVGTLQNGLMLIPSLDVFLVNSEVLNRKNLRISKTLITPSYLYAGTYDGHLLKMDAFGQILQDINLGRKAEVQSMFLDQESNWLYTFCDGLLIIDVSNGKMVGSHGITSTKSIDKFGDELVCGTSHGLIFPLSKNKNPEKAYVDSIWVRTVYFLSEDSVLFESDRGLRVYSISRDQVFPIRWNAPGIPSQLVRCNDAYFFRIKNSVYQLNKDLTVHLAYKSETELLGLFSTGKRLYGTRSDFSILSILPATEPIIDIANGLALKDIREMGSMGPVVVVTNHVGIQYFHTIDAPSQEKPRLSINRVDGATQSPGNRLQPLFKQRPMIFHIDLLPNLRNPGKGKVFYKIEGLQQEWTELAEKDEYVLELVRLPFGSHRLQLYGINTHGIKTDIQTFELMIPAPFYYRWWFIGILLIVLIGLVYLLLRWRTYLVQKKHLAKIEKQRLELKTLHAELTALRSQMNPHFIFNSLSSIQTKILNKEHVEAYQNLSTFAILLRQALQFTSKEFLSLKEELDFLQNYIRLEQMRTNNAFSYELILDPQLDLTNLQIPSLLLQPFAENAIRHGLMHSQNHKTLKTEIQKTHNGYSIKLTDNGIGRKKSSEINALNLPNHVSYASRAIQDRIELLKNSNKMIIDLEIIDLDQGTCVWLKVNLPVMT